MLRYRTRNAWEWISMLPWHITPLRNLFYPLHDHTKPYPRQRFWLERVFCPLFGVAILLFAVSAYTGGFTPAAGLYEKVLFGILIVLMLSVCVLGVWAGRVKYRSSRNWVQPSGATA